jgi:cyclic beta-1,2-glucan synthetase
LRDGAAKKETRTFSAISCYAISGGSGTVAVDAAVKLTILKVRNESGRSRRLSATWYVEWVLGDMRPKSAMQVATEVDPNSGALFARNPYNTESTGRVAFFDVNGANRTVTCDRTEFLGRNGTPRSPAAMSRVRLSGYHIAVVQTVAAVKESTTPDASLWLPPIGRAAQ